MNKHKINKFIAIVVMSSLGFLSTSAFAVRDEAQVQLTQQVHQAKQKLKQAEAAKGAKRQKLMGEHMKMMQETMKKMQTMKPKADMSMQEHEEWISEHQKLMDQMLEQMMGEHHLLMKMGGIPIDSGDMRKK